MSYCLILPQCTMLFYVIVGWYFVHCMFIANLPVVSYDVYINAQMVFIMLNEILLGLLMIISDIIDINETL